MQAPKNGFFYVIDRATGELLSADKYVEVNWASHVDMKTGRPVEIPGADYKDKGTYIRPGPLGGHNWQAMSFSPKTGLVYLPAQDNGRYFEQGKWNPADFKAIRAIRRKGTLPYNLALAPIDRNIEKYDIPYKGRLLAWDPVARKPKWTVEYGAYWNGGTLATAGNLVFQGTAAGDFIAYNAATGEKLWSSWADDRHRRAADHVLDRRQAIRVGDGGMGRRVSEEARELRPLADVCDRRHRVAAGEAARRARVTAIASNATPQQIAAGAKLYAHLLRALPRRRDDPAGSAALDAGGARGTREDSRRRAGRARHAALRGVR